MACHLRINEKHCVRPGHGIEQYTGLVSPVVLVWYIVTELGSMAENAANMGAPVPGWLLRLLAVSKNAIDSVGETLTGDDPNNLLDAGKQPPGQSGG